MANPINWLQTTFLFGNLIMDYIIALLIFIVVYFVLKYLIKLIIVFLDQKLFGYTFTERLDAFEKELSSKSSYEDVQPAKPLYADITESQDYEKALQDWHDASSSKFGKFSLKGIGWYIETKYIDRLSLFIALSYAFGTLRITPSIGALISIVLSGGIAWYGAQLAFDAVDVILESYDESAAYELYAKIAKVVIAIFILYWYITGLGYNLMTFILSLGIFGLAAALALGKLFEDLFASIVIQTERPFICGDIVKIGNDQGVVEKIGLITTRLQTADSTVLVIPNRNVIAATVENFSKAKARVVKLSIGISYDTTDKKLESFPATVEKAVTTVDVATLKRVSLDSFGDSAIIYSIAYELVLADFSQFTEVKNAVNLSIYKALRKAKYDIPYPTFNVLQPVE